jgi:diadenosine tetraphosphate (Ap4A) HIT family hydrolase
MSTLIHQRVELARTGQNPTVLAHLESGWAVIGDVQILNGYCLLLPDPVVPTLNDLTLRQREIFLRDMSILGDAILDATSAARINYEILGNSDHALHAHVIPRYEAEPDEFRTGPVWFYDFAKAPRLNLENPSHQALKGKIEAALKTRLASA